MAIDDNLSSSSITISNLRSENDALKSIIESLKILIKKEGDIISHYENNIYKLKTSNSELLSENNALKSINHSLKTLVKEEGEIYKNF
tara:strand:- start:3388 stop:3651 length:264 start_codon:yes stop_codon:yes gene_type:complete